jgi:hypothetical protein
VKRIIGNAFNGNCIWDDAAAIEMNRIGFSRNIFLSEIG